MFTLALALSIAQDSGASRSEQVLGLVREAASTMNMAWYERAGYLESASGRVDPRIPALCGNSDCGVVPDAPLRALALRACRIFGLEVAEGHDLALPDQQVEARLDAFDKERRIGVELSGGVPVDNNMMSVAAPESETSALSGAEAARLADLGYRIHVDDLTRFRCFDGGTFATSIAYLAGVVSFLNDVTEGEDIDLCGVLFTREAAWCPALPAALGAGILRKPDGRPAGLRDAVGFFQGDYVVGSPTIVKLSCAGVSEFLARRRFGVGLEPKRISTSTRGAPATLLVEGSAWKDAESPQLPEHRLRLRQLRAGVERVHEGSPRSLVLFLPGEFDLAEPFTLELELGPGNYRFNGVRLGACAAVEGSSTQPR